MVGLPNHAGAYPRLHRQPVIEPEETLADNVKAWEVLGWKPSAKIEIWFDKYKKDLGL